ncbi:hypothetical protein HW115_19540 [Verrucomicrobiaceae bacterium N1E253]|uniref:Uncharacterized protein n=2 Tax=Oceaniferula marina TaxID=2748318 RepID=A0A851GL76_9BACT|nr:hypothetical protein [Oceaniferula marina]
MQKAAEILISKGVDERIVKPPICRALWLCGVAVRPYIYIQHFKSATCYFLAMSITWGGIMRLTSWPSWTFSNIMASIGFGLFMTLFNRWFYHRSIKKVDLPDWADLMIEVQKSEQAEQVVAPDS